MPGASPPTSWPTTSVSPSCAAPSHGLLKGPHPKLLWVIHACSFPLGPIRAKFVSESEAVTMVTDSIEDHTLSYTEFLRSAFIAEIHWDKDLDELDLFCVFSLEQDFCLHISSLTCVSEA